MQEKKTWIKPVLRRLGVEKTANYPADGSDGGGWGVSETS